MALATKSPQRPARTSHHVNHPAARYQGNHDAADEINAYIAVRDGLLEEAEHEATDAAIERLVTANNFVANCLQPARLPYVRQCLPEIDAARELKRCQAVASRIAMLRARQVAAA
jgi:hypothetical protein